MVALSNDAASAAADAVVDLVDGGTGAGYIEIRSGSAPANVDTAATGDLLVTIELNDPAFGSAANGVAAGDVDPVPEGTGAGDGTAGYARIYDGDDTAVMDATVGTSDAEVILDTVTISTGLTVRLTALSYTQPTS